MSRISDSQYSERCAEIQQTVQQCLTLARQLYSTSIHTVDIRFDLRGRAAGEASLRGGQYTLRFNSDMIAGDSYQRIVTVTVPHEVAHLVCYNNPLLGRAHNLGWRRVCIALGGTGERCHSEFVIYARGKTYRYTTTLGHTVAVSGQLHGKIQQGAEYSVRGQGRVNQHCSYELVSEQPKHKPRARASHTISKAQQLRDYILEAQAKGSSPQTAVMWAMFNLDMTHSLAKTYVKNNWHRKNSPGRG